MASRSATPLRKLLDIQHKNVFQFTYKFKLTNKHLYRNNLERQKVLPLTSFNLT